MRLLLDGRGHERIARVRPVSALDRRYFRAKAILLARILHALDVGIGHFDQHACEDAREDFEIAAAERAA